MIDPATDSIINQIKTDLPTIIILGYFFYNQIKTRFQKIESMIEKIQEKIKTNHDSLIKLSDEINGHLSKN